MDYLGYFFGILTAIAIVFVILLILSFITVYVCEHFLSKFFKWIGVKTRSSQLQKDYEIPGLISEGFEQGLSSVEVSESMSAISRSLKKIISGCDGELTTEVDINGVPTGLVITNQKIMEHDGRGGNMSKPYWHCETCGGNFDFGERCDCGDPHPIVTSDEHFVPTRTSDLLVLSFDLSNGEDMSCLIISRSVGDSIEYLSPIFGKEAEDIYAVLTGMGPTERGNR